MKFSVLWCFLILIISLNFPLKLFSSDEKVILSAIEEELKRNSEKLQVEDFPKPYFISYSLFEYYDYILQTKLGGIILENENKRRNFFVNVRVGDYLLDNTEDQDSFMGLFDFHPRYIPSTLAPITSEPITFKHILWLLTDYNYKKALLSFQKVKGENVIKIREKKEQSFTKEESITFFENIKKFNFDKERWKNIILKISKKFLDYPEIFDSFAEIKVNRVIKYIVNTEGTRVIEPLDYFSIKISAYTRAEDGMLLEDSLDYFARDSMKLPLEEKIEEDLNEMITFLLKIRESPKLDPITVPAILSSEASGVFFHETIGHRLEAQRMRDEEEGKTFKGHIGKKIVPEFLNIYDDPSVKIFEGTHLNGYYLIDEEGVKAKKASLIENGVLKGLLLSRKPVEGFTKSNGHGRSNGMAPPSARMANLFIKSLSPLSHEKLKEYLIKEVKKQNKPYGIIIKKIAGGSTDTSSLRYQAFKGVPKVIYKVDPDTGKEELVRGVEIVGTPLASLNKIIATSDKYGVFNGYCGAESGYIPVSTIAPEILINEIELQRSYEMKERGLILPPPEMKGKN